MAREINWTEVASQLKESTEKKKYVREIDPNLYEPRLNAEGSADIILRFLPAPENDTVQIATVYSHSFEVGGKWLIAKCPATLGRTHKCPICEAASKVWNKNAPEGTPESFQNKNTVKQFKKASFYINVLIIKDNNTPENNNTVKVMRIPKKIYTKIVSKMNPSQEDLDSGESPIAVMDYIKGANFKLKIRSKKVPGYVQLVRDYDLSEFATPSPLGTEAFINEIDSKLISLRSYIENDIETYEKLQGRLDRVFGTTTDTPSRSAEERSGSSSKSSSSVSEQEDDDDEFLRKLREG